jgi:hypothetical protein
MRLRRRAFLTGALTAGAALATQGVAEAESTTVRRFGIDIVRRVGWGADESWRFDANGDEIMPQAYFPVQALTVHHAVTSNEDANPAATVRAIYRDQAVTQTWGDIGYHLLIDRNGTIYEGRWSGADTTPVFQGRHGDGPRMSNGAHVGGFNAGNLGVCLLGDFTAAQPTPAARRSLVRTLAGLAYDTGIDPLATVDYVNPISGARKTVPAIAAHREWAATACPGDAFYPHLPGVRTDVAASLERFRREDA